MANIVSTAISELATIAVELTVDKAELQAGALVKVGQVGSINGQPVFLYLSENASAT